jgi:hypothetical protein
MARKDAPQLVFPPKGGPPVCATCGRSIVMRKDLTAGHHILMSEIAYGSLFDEGWIIDTNLDRDHPVLYQDNFLPKFDPRYPDKYKVGDRVRWYGSYGTVVDTNSVGIYGMTVMVQMDDATSGPAMFTPGLDPFWGTTKRSRASCLTR